jgi:hypothetical protein
MTAEPHPDTLHDYARLKAIRRGSRQAIEDKAIEAYHAALGEGGRREEAEAIYFSFFNKVSHAKAEKQAR